MATSGSYRWNDHIQLYGAVDNAFNAPPPMIGSTGGGGTDCRFTIVLAGRTASACGSTTEPRLLVRKARRRDISRRFFFTAPVKSKLMDMRSWSLLFGNTKCSSMTETK